MRHIATGGKRGRPFGFVDYKYYWLLVSPDKYELPVIVAETIEELSAITGTKAKTIKENISHAKGRGGRSIYAKVLREEYGIL